MKAAVCRPLYSRSSPNSTLIDFSDLMKDVSGLIFAIDLFRILGLNPP